MNYKKGLQMVKEMNVAGGPGGMFGYGGTTIGQHGGDVGNSDSYAPGDARIAKVLGAGGNDPYENVNKKNKKGKKNKKDKIPLYRRTFAETMTMESVVDENDLILNCVIYSQDPAYHQIICDVLESKQIPYIVEDGIILEGTDEYMRTVLEKIQDIITTEPFENGEVIALMCEMDNAEPISANKIPGGKAANKTIEDFYHKYDPKGYYDIRNFKDTLIQKLKQGIKIEMEHTTDSKIAKEIATDHLWEDLEYYTKLAKIEKRG